MVVEVPAARTLKCFLLLIFLLQMNTKEVSHYRVIDFEAKRAIPPPPLDTTVTYATVQLHA